MRSLNILFCLAMAMPVLLSGCGSSNPATGEVEGTISLDGKPLDHATVTFQPTDGRSSIGVTDSEGHYHLRFSASEDGALPGEHTVMITTEQDATGGEGDQPLVPAREELLPEKYTTKSELTATVKPGSNTIDFDLTSK